LRNHSVKGSRRQEPWAFEPKTMRILRHYIRLRYRFLPYLYQLFIAQEERGEPILSPAFIDETSQPDWHRRDADFRIGALLLAPVVEEARKRNVRFPSGYWYCLRSGVWDRGGQADEARVPLAETPLFVRSGTLLPIASDKTVLASDGGAPVADQLIREFDLHVFLRPGERAELRYVQDDGATLGYQAGAERVVEFWAERRGVTVEVGFRAEQRKGSAAALPPLCVGWVLHGGATKLRQGMVTIAARPAKERMTGRPLQVHQSQSIVID
jgi:alpha-glucosidase